MTVTNTDLDMKVVGKTYKNCGKVNYHAIRNGQDKKNIKSNTVNVVQSFCARDFSVIS